MARAPELSVVLPTLNEADGLRVLLPGLKAVFVRLGIEGEVLVVDGGSRDQTEAAAREHGARFIRQTDRGFGGALRDGIAAASAPWVATMDADGSHPPEALERFWAKRAQAELVVGSRYCKGGSAVMPLSRQILSRSLNIATSWLLGLPVKDASSGLRLYKTELARRAGSTAADFSAQQELLAGMLRQGARVLEEPFRYTPRVGGASKASALRLAPAYLRLLFRLRLA